MNSKLLRTILLALAIGFFTMWILEFRRAGMFESYWLLLMSILSLLSFQFIRLKASLEKKKKDEDALRTVNPKSNKTAKK